MTISKFHGEVTLSSGKEGYGGGKDGQDPAFIYLASSCPTGLGLPTLSIGFPWVTARQPVSSNKMRG